MNKKSKKKISVIRITSRAGVWWRQRTFVYLATIGGEVWVGHHSAMRNLHEYVRVALCPKGEAATSATGWYVDPSDILQRLADHECVPLEYIASPTPTFL